MILCLETSTRLCSVALCDKDGVIALMESEESKSHASQLTLLAEEALRSAGISARDLQAVAVSRGPGSYTGLRIGVSVAKGIAWGASVPLIAADTMLSMFHGISLFPAGNDHKRPAEYFVPMLDARRMEVYYAIFDPSGRTVKETAAEVITGESFSAFPDNVKIVFFGDGSGKCRDVIRHPGAFFCNDFRISAAHMHIPVNRAFEEKRFEDVAYFEPFYLKDFIATQPVKNITGSKFAL